ncbi:MAG: hypothetical protein HYX68_10900 [Planctomycetes bacterium]|nr:hypothetical protein [Planctomycetota bacterium]
MPDPIDTLLTADVFSARMPGDSFTQSCGYCLNILEQRFPVYREFLRSRGVGDFPPQPSLADVQGLPAIFLPELKTCEFAVPKDVPIVMRLTSSGTTGKPSVTPLDEPSMRRRVQAMLASYRAAGIVSGSVEALAFLIDPSQTQMAGSVVIDAALRATPEVRSVRYLVQQKASGVDFALKEAVAAIQEAGTRGPVLLVGYPALMAAAMHGLASAGIKRLPLPAGSKILTGGGWKSFLPGVSLERDDFQKQMADFFGLAQDAIRDMFGLSECPAVFVQCSHGHYHVPAFTWAQAIDPETGAAVPDGELGLLQLTTPLTTSYPLLKILTTDKATLMHGCPCGVPAPYLVPRGRASAARFETCAMKMGQAVR